jgi:hypothetical protein
MDEKVSVEQEPIENELDELEQEYANEESVEFVGDEKYEELSTESELVEQHEIIVSDNDAGIEEQEHTVPVPDEIIPFIEQKPAEMNIEMEMIQEDSREEPKITKIVVGTSILTR